MYVHRSDFGLFGALGIGSHTGTLRTRGVEEHLRASKDSKRLEFSSFLVMTCFLLGDYNNILPKTELHSSLWV